MGAGVGPRRRARAGRTRRGTRSASRHVRPARPAGVRSRSHQLVDHHAFAVNGGRHDGQGDHRLDDQRHLVRPVLAVSREHAHAVAVAPGDEPEAVMLDLERPPRPVGHGARRRREAGLDETGRVGRRGGKASAGEIPPGRRKGESGAVSLMPRRASPLADVSRSALVASFVRRARATRGARYAPLARRVLTTASPSTGAGP